ncbi:MAG: hypothetical protein V4502_01215, partial [Pseudomonadota bacterium]
LREGFSGLFTNKSSLSFDSGAFNLDTSNLDARLSIDYANGPASRSINQTITGNRWTFINTEAQGTSSASYGLFGTLQVNAFSSASYNRIGANTTTSSFLSSANDLLITGRLEVDSSASFDDGVAFTAPAPAWQEWSARRRLRSGRYADSGSRPCHR